MNQPRAYAHGIRSVFDRVQAALASRSPRVSLHPQAYEWGFALAI